MNLPSRMELTFASDPTDPRNALDLGESVCERCLRDSDDLRQVKYPFTLYGREVGLRLCPDCRVDCPKCGRSFTLEQGRRGVLEDHECRAIERRTMGRPKKDAVRAAFDGIIALTTDQRTLLDAMLEGYGAQLDKPKAAPRPRAPKAPKQEAVA